MLLVAILVQVLILNLDISFMTDKKLQISKETLAALGICVKDGRCFQGDKAIPPEEVNKKIVALSNAASQARESGATFSGKNTATPPVLPPPSLANTIFNTLFEKGDGLITISPVAIAKQGAAAHGDQELLLAVVQTERDLMISRGISLLSTQGARYDLDNNTIAQINLEKQVGLNGETIKISGGINYNFGEQLSPHPTGNAQASVMATLTFR